MVAAVIHLARCAWPCILKRFKLGWTRGIRGRKLVRAKDLGVEDWSEKAKGQ
jgi:hypothetical protein